MANQIDVCGEILETVDIYALRAVYRVLNRGEQGVLSKARLVRLILEKIQSVDEDPLIVLSRRQAIHAEKFIGIAERLAGRRFTTKRESLDFLLRYCERAIQPVQRQLRVAPPAQRQIQRVAQRQIRVPPPAQVQLAAPPRQQNPAQAAAQRMQQLILHIPPRLAVRTIEVLRHMLNQIFFQGRDAMTGFWNALDLTSPDASGTLGIFWDEDNARFAHDLLSRGATYFEFNVNLNQWLLDANKEPEEYLALFNQLYDLATNMLR